MNYLKNTLILVMLLLLLNKIKADNQVISLQDLPNGVTFLWSIKYNSQKKDYSYKLYFNNNDSKKHIVKILTISGVDNNNSPHTLCYFGEFFLEPNEQNCTVMEFNYDFKLIQISAAYGYRE